MKFFLLAIACLVSKAEEPLPVQGKFNTIYLAGKSEGLIAENSQVRLLMREVTYFDQYRVMRMIFYVRKNGKCQLQTVWADKIQWKFCAVKWYVFQALWNGIFLECPEKNGTDSISGVWKVRDTIRHFPNIYFYPAVEGGLYRTTGKNINEEMWKEYVNLTQELGIPTENIENIYESDSCPKWGP